MGRKAFISRIEPEREAPLHIGVAGAHGLVELGLGEVERGFKRIRGQGRAVLHNGNAADALLAERKIVTAQRGDLFQ